MANESENSGPPNEEDQTIRLNLRKAVRYARSDINGELIGKGLFRSSRPFPIELRDISTRGAYIVSPRKLSLNGSYTLKLSFEDGKEFLLDGKIIHKKAGRNDAYGFRFNTYNDALGDYLLDTQTDLIFK